MRRFKLFLMQHRVQLESGRPSFLETRSTCGTYYKRLVVVVKWSACLPSTPTI